VCAAACAVYCSMSIRRQCCTGFIKRGGLRVCVCVCECVCVLQCVAAVYCNVSQCVALYCAALKKEWVCTNMLVCCSALQFVEVCCSIFCNILQCIVRFWRAKSFAQLGVYCSVLQFAAACCSVLQSAAACCSLLQRVAEFGSAL